MFESGDGGGFFNGDSSFGGGSPQVSKKSDQKRAQNIMPVTARQVLGSPDDGLKIGNVNVYLVTLVGIVRAIESSSVKITYTLEDNTGCVEGVHWIEAQDDRGQATQPQVVENSYCRLSGTIRTQGNKRFIMAFNVQEIEEFNEITTHFLEVALFSKQAEALGSTGGVMDSSVGNTTVPSNGMGNNLTNSLITSSAGPSAPISGLSPLQSKVLTAIQRCIVENGLHSEDIMEQLKGSASRHEVQIALEFLCGEGHIYTTIDDNHYRTTDGM